VNETSSTATDSPDRHGTEPRVRSLGEPVGHQDGIPGGEFANSLRPPGGRQGRRRFDQFAGVLVPRIAQQFQCGARFHHPAAIHHHQVFGAFGGQAEIMGDEQHRRPEFTGEAVDMVEDPALHGDIESGGRFVGDQEPGTSRQRHRDQRALPQAAGQLVRVLVDPLLRIRYPRGAQ
jgi:hypothetical protein